MTARFEAQAPRVVTLENGRQAWEYEGGLYPNVGLNAVIGRPKHEWSMDPANFDEMRRGCWDIDARVADMDRAGIAASVCFPSLIAGFAGTVFSRSKDPDLGLACARAWNDWHLDVWAGTHPGRIIPTQITWLADPQVAADMVRENAARGFRALSFTEFPACGAAVVAHRPLGRTAGGVRGDRDRAVPPHRVVVVGPDPVRRPAVRAVADAVPRERVPGVQRLAVVGGLHAVPRVADRAERGRHRVGEHARRPRRLRARALGVGDRERRGTTPASRARCSPRASGSARSTIPARSTVCSHASVPTM